MFIASAVPSIVLSFVGAQCFFVVVQIAGSLLMERGQCVRAQCYKHLAPLVRKRIPLVLVDIATLYFPGSNES